jgi:hypothetical protein
MGHRVDGVFGSDIQLPWLDEFNIAYTKWHCRKMQDLYPRLLFAIVPQKL